MNTESGPQRLPDLKYSLLWKIWSEKNRDWLDSLPSACLKEFTMIPRLFEMTCRFRDIVSKRSNQDIPAWIETCKIYSFPSLNTFITYRKRFTRDNGCLCWPFKWGAIWKAYTSCKNVKTYDVGSCKWWVVEKTIAPTILIYGIIFL